jgi:hypothetical protein
MKLFSRCDEDILKRIDGVMMLRRTIGGDLETSLT